MIDPRSCWMGEVGKELKGGVRFTPEPRKKGKDIHLSALAATNEQINSDERSRNADSVFLGHCKIPSFRSLRS